MRGLAIPSMLLAMSLAACASPPPARPVGIATPRLVAHAVADAAIPDASLDAGAPSDAADDATVATPSEPPSPCPTDMLAIASPEIGAAARGALFCIDRYEAPNLPGAMPLAFRTAPDGDAWCAERGKRLCQEDEWVRACRGPAQRPFPYGSHYEGSRCNDTKPWKAPKWRALAHYPADASVAEADRLYQADPSGTRESCVSEEGVYDLTGNVAEWVRRTDPTRTNHDHIIKGCFWAGCYKTPEVSCSFKNPAHPGTFRSYEVGFRCCKEASDVGARDGG